MAGRGRGMTLPAWMAKDPNATSSIIGNGPETFVNDTLHHDVPGYGIPSDHSQFADAPHSYGALTASVNSISINQGSGFPADVNYEAPRRRDRSRSPGRGRDRDKGFVADRGGGVTPGYGQSRRSRRSNSASRERSRRENRRRRRKERGTNFDVLPEGMDEATANQIAAQAFLQQSLPQAASAVPMPAMLIGPSAAPSMQQTRHARRLYVGNIPRVSEEEVQRFFDDILNRALDQPMEGGPVVSVYLNPDRGFAFVELRSVALTTAAMQLDGISYGDIQLKIRRPSDYNAGAVPSDAAVEPLHLNLSALGIVSTTVQDTPNKVFVGGLPYHLTEEQVKELLSAFGHLKSLHLVKEAGAVNSKGYAFCEYMDPSVTEIACEGLNGMPLGDKTITMRRAMSTDSTMLQQAGLMPIISSGYMNMGLPVHGMLPSAAEQMQLAHAMAALDSGSQKAVTESAAAATVVRSMQATRILVLLNMVGEEELENDEDYSEIYEDVQQECQQFGNLRSVIIPRPGKQGVGKVFLEYATVEQAQNAAMSLAGRQFASKIVKAEYHDENRFAMNDLA